MNDMRSLVAGLVVLCAVSTAGDVLADVGPAPKCPDGTHSAYLKGRRCVKNGYVLRENSEGHVEEVPFGIPVKRGPKPVPVGDDVPKDVPPTAPDAPPVPEANTPPAPAPASSTPPSAPEKKAGGCQTTDRSAGAASTLSMFAAVSLLLLARRRRAPSLAERR